MVSHSQTHRYIKCMLRQIQQYNAHIRTTTHGMEILRPSEQ